MGSHPGARDRVLSGKTSRPWRAGPPDLAHRQGPRTEGYFFSPPPPPRRLRSLESLSLTPEADCDLTVTELMFVSSLALSALRAMSAPRSAVLSPPSYIFAPPIF